jgi:two-component system OmpR family response regulator
MDTSARILVVAGNDNFRRTICRILSRCGYCTAVAHSGEDAVAALERDGYDLVLAEVALPDICGLTVLCRTRQSGHGVPFVLLTECETERARWIMSGIEDVRCLPLPLDVDRLKSVVAESVRRPA